MSPIYNIKLCGICEIPNNLQLVKITAVTNDGKTYLDLMEYIFNDISWTEDTLPSACNICIKKIEDTAEFKKICLESNNRNKSNNFKCDIGDLLNASIDDFKDDILNLEDTVADKFNRTERSAAKRKTRSRDVEIASNLQEEIFHNTETRNTGKKKTRTQELDLEHDLKLLEDKCSGEEAGNVLKRTIRQRVVKSDVKKKIKGTDIRHKEIQKNTDETDTEIIKAKDFSCEFCPTSFHTMDKFDRHVYKHNGIRKYTCNVCDTKFITTQDLSAHKRLWCTQSKTSCSLCPGKSKRFSPELLAVHMKVEHMIEVSKDDSNLTSLMSDKELAGETGEIGKINGDRKRRKKLKQKIFPCHICQMEFTRSTHLDKHVYNHDGTKNHICHDCGTKFITTDDLRNHKRVVHLKKEDYKFLCMECGARFPISSGLKMHMLRSHTNNRNFTCDICHKSFYQKRDVENHLTTHSNRREFKCDLCPAEYKRKQVLQVHKFKAHGIGVCKRKAIDKYKCPFCMKIISSKAKLPRHIRTHTGVKPFKCRLCDSKFTCNSYVKNHVKQKHHINVDASDFSATFYYEICEIGDPVEENAGIRVTGDEDDDEHITCDV